MLAYIVVFSRCAATFYASHDQVKVVLIFLEHNASIRRNLIYFVPQFSKKNVNNNAAKNQGQNQTTAGIRWWLST